MFCGSAADGVFVKPLGGLHEHTLALVFGDHGQTLNGDHGGGSDAEVDTALVAFNLGWMHNLSSTREQPGATCPPLSVPSGREPATNAIKKMAQVDLVPTLALLMGLPIPFGNVGSVSEEIWGVADSKGESTRSSFGQALEVNAYQVSTCLHQHSPGASCLADRVDCLMSWLWSMYLGRRKEKHWKHKHPASKWS